MELKLNKYLINIVNDYVIIDYKILITENLPKREGIIYKVNRNLTIEDIIIKAFQKGYKGFKIHLNLNNIITYIDSICNYVIATASGKYSKFYNFIGDTRDLYYIDITELDNVTFKSTQIVEN